MKKPHKKMRKRFFLTLSLLISTGTLWQCGGLVRLDIPADAYRQPDETWLTPYRNNLRQNSLNRDVIPPYQIFWNRGTRSVVTDHPLAMDNYLIITLKNGTLAFFNIERGNKLGDGHIAPGFQHSSVVSGDTLYYAANLGEETLGAFNLSNLRTVWKKKLPHLNTTPLLWKDKLYVGADDGKLFCLNRTTGNKIWEFDTGDPIMGIPASLNNKIYFSNIKGKFFSLDMNTGEKIWQTKLKENIYAGPLIGEDKIIIGSTAGILYGLSIENGRIQWMADTHSSIYGNAAYKDGLVYVGNNGHKLLALDISNGKIVWTFQTTGIINTAPLVGESFIYFGSWDKYFYVLNRYSGDLIYRQKFDHPIKSSPIIYRDRIFLHIANDNLYCLGTQKIANKEGE